MGAFVLLALFIGVPLLEIALFIQIGGLIGLGPTIATVILTAVIGTALVRHQGLATLTQARATLDAGTLPVKELFDGACILVAGLLMLTPGFFTDSLGLALLIPPIRDLLRVRLGQAMEGRVDVQAAGFGPSPGARPGGGTGGATPVIDGDFVDVTTSADPDPDTPPDSGGGRRPSGPNPWGGDPEDRAARARADSDSPTA